MWFESGLNQVRKNSAKNHNPNKNQVENIPAAEKAPEPERSEGGAPLRAAERQSPPVGPERSGGLREAQPHGRAPEAPGGAAMSEASPRRSLCPACGAGQ